MRMAFKSCMDFRKKILQAKNNRPETVPVYEHLTDLVETTLCPKGDKKYHDKACVNRTCESCGIDGLQLLEEETDTTPTAPKVKWQRFEYVNIQHADGQEKRKLQLVIKETDPGNLFKHLKELLKGFPSHQFRASWQHEQLERLLDNLPQNHVCCIHDYSENYSCNYQNEVQSCYYSQTQASIHVTILHRHALNDTDGVGSLPDAPLLVTEHIFVISPDCKHDHHSVHQCRGLIADYLKSIQYNATVMHEFTDGCSAQYKSRHCMGDVSFSVTDFGFFTIRNYYETSHAKGPQDGAGANLKHKADMAVIKGNEIIQNARDLFDYAERNLKEPAPSRYQSENVTLKRRIFFYVDKVNRDRPYRLFTEVKGNRSIHSIISTCESNSLDVRQLSCYCNHCIDGDYSECEDKEHLDDWETIEIQQEKGYGHQRATRGDIQEQREGIKDLVTKDALIAIASGDPGVEYYLLKVTGNGPEVLTEKATNDWSCTYRAGAEVFHGNFLVAETAVSQDRLYKLGTTKKAIVYATTA